MLSKCANPECSTQFRRLRDGKLFQVQAEYFPRPPRKEGPQNRRPSRHVEHYWLCNDCSLRLTLALDRERGMIMVPLSGPEKKPARSEAQESPEIRQTGFLGA